MPTTTNPPRDDVRALLRARRAGDEGAERELFERLYDELHRLARARFRGERDGHTLTPTSLVHEAFLRLSGAALPCEDRDDFLRLAAAVMRRVLVDGARRRRSRRLGTDAAPLAVGASDRDAALLRLEPALERLGRCDPDCLRVVELRFLLGFEVVETAELLGVSPATVKRHWSAGRAFLQREIERDDDP